MLIDSHLPSFCRHRLYVFFTWCFFSFASAVWSASAYCQRSDHSGFFLSLPFHPFEVAESSRFVLCYAPLSSSPMSFHLMPFQLSICGLIRFCSLSTPRSLRFLPSLPFHPLEVAGSSRFVLCYAPLFSFSVFFHPMPYSASHLQFYPLLLTANAPFTPISSITTLSTFRGCREKKFRPLLRTIV